jgi:hypothetical protein
MSPTDRDGGRNDDDGWRDDPIPGGDMEESQLSSEELEFQADVIRGMQISGAKTVVDTFTRPVSDAKDWRRRRQKFFDVDERAVPSRGDMKRLEEFPPEEWTEVEANTMAWKEAKRLLNGAKRAAKAERTMRVVGGFWDSAYIAPGTWPVLRRVLPDWKIPIAPDLLLSVLAQFSIAGVGIPAAIAGFVIPATILSKASHEARGDFKGAGLLSKGTALHTGESVLGMVPLAGMAADVALPVHEVLSPSLEALREERAQKALEAGIPASNIDDEIGRIVGHSEWAKERSGFVNQKRRDMAEKLADPLGLAKLLLAKLPVVGKLASTAVAAIGESKVKKEKPAWFKNLMDGLYPDTQSLVQQQRGAKLLAADVTEDDLVIAIQRAFDAGEIDDRQRRAVEAMEPDKVEEWLALNVVRQGLVDDFLRRGGIFRENEENAFRRVMSPASATAAISAKINSLE